MRIRFSIRRLRHLPITWWVFTCFLAISAGVIVTNSLGAAQQKAEQWGKFSLVPVAVQELPTGSLITDAAITIQQWPTELLPHTPIAPQPLGSRTSVAIWPGEPLVANKLAPGGQSPIAALLQAGEQSFDIPHDGHTPNVQAGDTVSVLGATKKDGGPLLLVRTARVLTTGERMTTIAIPTEKVLDLANALDYGNLDLSVTSPATFNSVNKSH